jgi:prophage regulatory protein
MENDHQNPKPQSSLHVGQPRVLRLKEVCKVTGLGRSFIYQLQAEQKFPHSIKIGVRAVGWLEGEIRDWLGERIRISRKDS